MTTSRRDEIFTKLKAGNLPWGSAFTDGMLIYNHDGNKWDIGTIKPFGPLPLHPASSILHYGTGVFEGAKAFAGSFPESPPRLFRPDKHIQRLARGCRRLALPAPPESLLDGLQALVHKEASWVPKRETGSLYLRIGVVGTGEAIGVKRPVGAMCFVICGPVGGYFSGGGKKRGLKLYAQTEHFRAMRGGVGHVKAGANYGPAMVPAENAKKQGYDQILWLSDEKDRFVTESGMMNFMIVLKNGEVWTPPADDYILPGITRLSIIELVKEKLGKDVKEKSFSIDWLCEAISKGEVKEMLGTGTGAIADTVSTVGYRGKDYTVPDVLDSESMVVWIKKVLSDVQGSKLHPWMVESKSSRFKGDVLTK